MTFDASASREGKAKFPRVSKTTVLLVLAVLTTSVTLRAQSPATQPPAENASEGSASDAGLRLGGTFKANEGMMILVPLDTASVLNGSYPIDSAGFVNLPVVGRLFVHDQTSGQVETFLGKRMSQYLRDTHVMATPVVRLAMLGFWQHPGMHYVDPELSVWDACRVVGGPAGEVNIGKWRVMRGSRVLDISLLDEFSKGTTVRNAGIRSGDLFIIPVPNPQSGFWYWFRETLTVTAQITSIVGTTLTAYITYLVLEDRNDP